MIRLAPTKALDNEERVHTAVPHPRQLLEPIQDFLDFPHKTLFSFLYEPLRLIHVDLYLQYFIQKRCLYVHLVDLPIHGRFYDKNPSNENEFGHMDKGLIDIHSNHLRLYFCY